MNRRKALMVLFALSGVSVVSGVVYKWMYLGRNPDIGYLENNDELLAELAEMIIPRTDSPGAKDAGVEKTMVHLALKMYKKRDLNNFIDGLKGIQDMSMSRFGLSFVRLSSGQKKIIFRDFHKDRFDLAGRAGKVRDKLIGKTFFTILKDITTISFCTSQIGATIALEYVKIPVMYGSCISISSGKRAWAVK